MTSTDHERGMCGGPSVCRRCGEAEDRRLAKRKGASDGGLAFPCGESWESNDYVNGPQKHSRGPLHGGMTLLDYFAAASLSQFSQEFNPADAAEWAYKYAEAMLAERTKRSGKQP